MPNITVIPEDRTCPRCGTVFQLGGRGRPPRKRIYCSNECAGKSRVVRPAVNESTPVQAAYLAGLFDGEGSIILWERGYGTRLALRITITNTDRGLLEWVLDTVGSGSIVHKPRRVQNPNHSPGGHWQIYAQNAVNVLEQMMPYLVLKKAHAVHAIASQRPPFPRELYPEGKLSPRQQYWQAFRDNGT